MEVFYYCTQLCMFACLSMSLCVIIRNEGSKSMEQKSLGPNQVDSQFIVPARMCF